MNKLILLVVLTLLPALANGYMLLPIVRVYDGDTIMTTFNNRIPSPLNKISIRIYGIDAPEMPAKSYATTGYLGRARCTKEAVMALRARDYIRAMTVGHRVMKVYDFKWGKYGGRIVGKVKINGVDIGQVLLKEGLVKPYFGHGKKTDWCHMPVK